MYIYKNKNPGGIHVGDCVIRAISEVMDTTWEEAYLGERAALARCLDSLNY